MSVTIYGLRCRTVDRLDKWTSGCTFDLKRERQCIADNVKAFHLLSPHPLPVMRRASSSFEEVAGHRLPLGGINGYRGVRGGQGRSKKQYQGVTPKKRHRTKLFDAAQEAAIALAQLQEDIELGVVEHSSEKAPEPAAANVSSKMPELGRYLGHLLHSRQPVVPTITAVLLRREQAAAAVARGVAVAYADVVC